jgi:predicted neuraminidase
MPRHCLASAFLLGVATLITLLASAPATAEDPHFSTEPLFAPEPKHNHASCLVELDNGDLLVAWYRGTGERDADDVQILGSRLRHGTPLWEPRFLLADTPGYPDCNPALFAPADGSVWLFWPTILDHRWEGALLKYRRAPEGGDRGAPPWDGPPGVLHVTPTGFAAAMDDAVEQLREAIPAIDETRVEKIVERARDELYQRLGWMPRVHPLVLPSGRWLLPLYSDTFSCSLIGISDDQGTSWTFGRPLIGHGNIQPSLVRRNDGTLVAYMRENGPRRKIRISTSRDEGKTWSQVSDSTLPNPGAGIEALRLANGHWAMVFNDTTSGRHSLAVALSENEGERWPIARAIERTDPGENAFHYPSIIQARDGDLHVTYTRRTGEVSTIQHARFNEAWVRQSGP